MMPMLEMKQNSSSSLPTKKNPGSWSLAKEKDSVTGHKPVTQGIVGKMGGNILIWINVLLLYNR